MEFAISLRQSDSTPLRQKLAIALQQGWRRFVVDNFFLENELSDRDSFVKVQSALQEFGVSVAALTLPLSSRFDITCRDGETRMDAVCHIANFMFAAKTLGIPTVVLCVSPSLPSPHGNDTRSALRALEGLVESAEIMKINLALKNLVDSLSRSTLEAALAEYPSPNFGFCYNSRFDHLAGDEPLSLLDRYGNRLKMIELSEGDERTTGRAPVSAGMIDWAELCRRIVASGYDRVVHLESLDRLGDSRNDDLKHLAEIRDKLAKLWES